jgi:hypothetical protein
LVDARVARKRNDKRPVGDQTHFARAQQKLLKEWHADRAGVNFSGDDMNIIQVGRPAVSRYHNSKKFYPQNASPDYDVHDFPTAELGLKLGGFMIQGE